MATIVNNPPSQDTGSGAGWAVAAIVILLVLLIAYFGFAHFGGHSAAPSANINVSLPSGGSAGGSGGGTAGQ